MVVVVAGITAIAIASGTHHSSNSSATPTPGGCTPTVAPGPAVIGDAAPTFRLPGLGGGCVDLAALHGHPVIVNFWASWCFPCRQEMPMLRSAYNKYHHEGLEIVGIPVRDIDSDSRAFAAKYGARWRIARDPNGDTAHAYSVRPVPESVFVRADGTVAARLNGMTRADLRENLAKILPRG